MAPKKKGGKKVRKREAFCCCIVCGPPLDDERGERQPAIPYRDCTNEHSFLWPYTFFRPEEITYHGYLFVCLSALSPSPPRQSAKADPDIHPLRTGEEVGQAGVDVGRTVRTLDQHTAAHRQLPRASPRQPGLLHWESRA